MRCLVSLSCCVTAFLICLAIHPSSACEDPKNYTNMINILARQVMLQQLSMEERVRSEGGSGIKQKRLDLVGRKPYYNDNHGGFSAVAMHDHANLNDTVGLGEFIAILNGVEFRTRHNDFRLMMPSTKSKNYHEVESIPFPDVPLEVLQETNVTKAVDKMKEWFRAFLNQDSSVRDYTKFFKPILCYLEGHWMIPSDTLEDPFSSLRHQIDAKTWEELQDKVRYTAANGAKSNLENFSYLPTAITNVTDGVPEIAQWTYRLLCHPLKTDVPLSRFQIVDDLVPRLTYRLSMENHATWRTARFRLDPRLNLSDTIEPKTSKGFLDNLMGEIPGLDNYQANLTDSTFGMLSYEVRDDSNDPLKLLNAGFYHRFFQQSIAGAMGQSIRHRSFSDPSIFMAQTSNPRVPKVCAKFQGRDELLDKWVKHTECQRWTYAVPLEIIYLTPLSKWNHYNLTYKGNMYGPGKSEEADWVRMGGRNGYPNPETAYNGTNSHTFFHTPKEFFQGFGLVSKADTHNRFVGVLDPEGNMQNVATTGIRINFNIDGLGQFRQRWPMFDVPGQFSSVGKDVEALKDILLGGTTGAYKYLYYNQTTPE